ncbi:hypothetical protein ACFWWC_00760 [Streptomyces sp. NPDC058642]|uniref:hypothetical protein n=1 Tax=Streptomyces sp. NPDC058642 TaxID=3346572 RepID=UPI003654A77E
MTIINLAAISDDAIHDAQARELLAGAAFGVRPGSQTAPPAPPVNLPSVVRVAYLLALRGVRVTLEGGGHWAVIGSGPASYPLEWDAEPAPQTCWLLPDLTGHIEADAFRKVAYRACASCGENFTTIRGRKGRTSRWPSLCGSACRKAADAARKRASRAV